MLNAFCTPRNFYSLWHMEHTSVTQSNLEVVPINNLMHFFKPHMLCLVVLSCAIVAELVAVGEYIYCGSYLSCQQTTVHLSFGFHMSQLASIHKPQSAHLSIVLQIHNRREHCWGLSSRLAAVAVQRTKHFCINTSVLSLPQQRFLLRWETRVMASRLVLFRESVLPVRGSVICSKHNTWLYCWERVCLMFILHLYVQACVHVCQLLLMSLSLLMSLHLAGLYEATCGGCM